MRDKTQQPPHTWVLMTQAFEACQRAVEQELDRHGATLAQLNMLRILDQHKTLTMGQISEHVFREQHSVSAQASRMIKLGLVKKTRSTKDERVVTVKITPKGKELLDLIEPLWVKMAEDIVRSIPEEELPAFDENLKTVRDAAMGKLGRVVEAV